MNYLVFRQFIKGSNPVVCAREGGANTTPFQAAHFALRNTRSNPAEKSVRRKNFRAKPKQAGKKEGGWGEGIFARLLLSGGMAEGGFGGNSAMPERIQKEAAPAALLGQSRSQSKSFLFLLEEKNRRAQIKKCEENFFAGWRASASGGGAASLVGVLLKKSSNINQKRPQVGNICLIKQLCPSKCEKLRLSVKTFF